MARVDTVFLDRDGVINVYLRDAYVERPDQLEIVPGAAKAIRALNDAGIPVIVISNQQGVGKGLMTAEDLDLVDRSMREKLNAEAGASLGRSYYCPHLKSDLCQCRKPLPGMLLDAAREFDIDLARAAFIGDSAGDMAAASAAGVGLKILVLCGSTDSYNPGDFAVEPDKIFPSVAPAVEWLLEDDT